MNKFLSFLCLILIVSCKKNEQSKPREYHNASITIFTDDSYKSVVEALAEAYMISYPEAKVDVKVEKEDIAFMNLLENKAKMITFSRNLSEKDKENYKLVTEMEYKPTAFAADAVVFVVPKSSERERISVEEIKKELHSDEKKLIFDGTNAGNLNFVAQKINEEPKNLKFSIIKGNENVIKQLHQYPNKIGVVSLNTISRPHSTEAKRLREMVKILEIVDGKTAYVPNIETIKNMKYPFTRTLYFLANETTFNIANGIMRFSCSQIGQMVVEKEGLQPYYLYKREVEMR
ncbi:MAG: substrate-binding domain-containing protein [Bergeyella zoohelcum]|nr:substrate-binding domain-containing protein [Bergeyella zoohelcum]